MKIIKITKQFKKDLKRIQHDNDKLEALDTVLKFLRDTGTVPESYNPHQLIGNYKNFMECHVGSDYLLIWKDEELDVIKLARLGSHSELF